MTDEADLERSYRRLLAWYPRAFRREKGPEILAVLMAGARDGQRRPGLAGSADLIRSGLWMRLRPGVPGSARTVRAAVRFMCGGAAVSTVNLIISLAVIGDIEAYHAVLGHRLPAAPVSGLNTSAITVAIVLTLVPIALWLWMARETGQGRNWARSLSTVLFGLATLSLASVFPPSGINLSFVPTVHLSFVPALGPTVLVLTWLPGAAAVWLLWLPASTVFFRPPGYTQALHQAQMAELKRIRSSRLTGSARPTLDRQREHERELRARMPRQV
ncbi:MAG: hypothetical protein ACRDP5_03410 [Streptosporangiaceae bacterium]